MQVALPEEEKEASGAFSFFDLADRILSRSRDPIAQNLRNLAGEYLAGRANAETAQRLQALIEQRARKAQKQAAEYAKPAPPPSENPYEVLGFPPDKPLLASEIKARQRELARMFHPDKGGSVRAMQRVNDAATTLLSQIS